MNRNKILNLLLVFTLLFSQMGGLAHGVTHTHGEKSSDSEHSLPHDKYCDQCAAYAQIGSAVGSSSINFASNEVFAAPFLHETSSFVSQTFVAFAARAPPYSI
ncbi:MAG: DUF2946 family protein [Gallionella sp.]